MNTATNILSPFYNLLVSSRYKVLRHICLIAILVIVSLNFILPYIENYGLADRLIIGLLLCILVSFLVAVYFTIYFLIPQYLLQKKYNSFIGWLTVTTSLMLIIQCITETSFCHLMGIEPFPAYRTVSIPVFVVDVLGNFLISFIALTGGSVTILLKNWLTYSQKATTLEKEQMRNEVEHLKEQINPGFMFRTLRHAGTLEETNPLQASDILMKLSRLLRYQLYDCNHRFVFLLSEIRYIENYLLIEKTYYPAFNFSINIYGDANTTLVPPLLFIPFVQFMAGRMKDTDMQKTLNIQFSCDDEAVKLSCSISADRSVRHKVILQVGELEMVNKRLRLLIPDDYKLDFYGKDPLSIDSLTLQLNISIA